MSAAAYSIVLICTGNRFRSALAEAFVHRLTLGLPVSVESFGTSELGDVPPLSEAVEIGRWYGVDLSNHRARHLGLVPLTEIDLVVGFEHAHVHRAVVDARAPRDRSFAFRELVQLLREIDPPPTDDVILRARTAVERAAELRATRSAPSADDEVIDPFGRSWKIHRQTAAEVRELSIALVAALFGVASTRGLPPVPARLSRSRPSLWRFLRARFRMTPHR